MAVCPFSEQTLFSALALRKLGREEVRCVGSAGRVQIRFKPGP